jgi:hypothetical protein
VLRKPPAPTPLRSEPIAAEVVAEGPAVPESEWAALDGEDWRELIKQKGKRVGDVLRQANAIATELGVDAPASAAGIAEADPVLRDRLGAWIDGGGQ